MSVTTGLVCIQPWGTVEWVTVRHAGVDAYRIVYDNKELFTVEATEQSELIEKISKGWRTMFPDSP
jgi:hypothetical protein